MKKIANLLLLSCLLLLQSCFEIVEQVLVKNDGSGNFQLVLNMSRSKTKLNSIMKMKTVNGHEVPGKADINREVAEIERIIRNTPGISHVKTTLDFDNYIATIGCNFLKVDNLNAGIRNIARAENSTRFVENTYSYDGTGKIFSRINKFLLKAEYQKMSNADKEIFATANYTAIFRFENEVGAISNKQSKLSANKKAVMLKLNILDVIMNKKSIENNINLLK